jgi:hypothetical protein
VNKDNFIFENNPGSKIFARLLSDGTEVWVVKHKSFITSAGINKIPRHQYLQDKKLKTKKIKTLDRFLKFFNAICKS